MKLSVFGKGPDSSVEVALDCRHYIGDRPCKFNRECRGCPDYFPQGTRILIIKTGALGDVLRTTILLGGIKRKYPDSHLTWITAPSAVPLVPKSIVDRVWPYSVEVIARLSVEEFDLVLSLDKEPEVAALAMLARSKDKRGMGVDGCGSVYPLNGEMAYYYRLGLDNDLKFHHNRRTYPDLLAEAVNIPYDPAIDDYQLDLKEEDREKARCLFLGSGLAPGQKVLGINTGAGGVFVNKDWTLLGYVALLQELEKKGITVLLLGGDRESDRISELHRRFEGPFIKDVGTGHSLGVFAALVSLCHVVLTGDTLGMHVGLSVGARVVSLFGSTQPTEIEMFGRGEKIITPIECSPCYKRSCDIHPSCMELIRPETVLASILRQWELPPTERRQLIGKLL
ncbi:MAG: glycosyltransferase family 9 protein [Leptospirillum sp.]|jgi:heptosyltransferase-2|nr:glycosyltransferase family 9 protein [Nitrospiraceae bacterium]MDA8150851.1 glycosyltransferase family 9 protein [Nitrospiraceae bacterium]